MEDKGQWPVLIFILKKKERKEKKNDAETSEVDYIPVINNCFNSHDREAPPFDE